MVTVGRSFCWPCRHYRPGQFWSDAGFPVAACAAFPDGIPAIISAGGFDHREPHPHDNGVRFEIRTDERFDWDEKKTDDFLDLQLRRFNQRQRRAKALGGYGDAKTDTPPNEAALERFAAPVPIRLGEDAIRAAAAWEEYRLTGDPEALYEAGVWARPEDGEDE